jgi:hypothetical protein
MGKDHGGNGKPQHPLLEQLSPLLEVTAVIRPRLLLGAALPDGEPMLLALLYHREKDAFQSRLRFSIPGNPQFLRRTKWRQWSNPFTFARRREKIERDFCELGAKVGGAISQVEFPPDASDEEILRALLASPFAQMVK